MLHKDNLFHSPEGGNHLSPHSHPRNPRTDPFFSPGEHRDNDRDSTHSSPYGSVIHSPDEMMHTIKPSVQFESVDWATRKTSGPKPRNITPTKELEGHVETIDLTPPSRQLATPQPPGSRQITTPQPTFHEAKSRPASQDSVPSYKSGLGINMPFDDEKKHAVQTSPSSWEPTAPPPSHYVPYREFEDVELNRQGAQARGLPMPAQTLGGPANEKGFTNNNGDYPSRRNFRNWLWLLYIIIFLFAFMALPLIIFGAVYHWNYGEWRCNRSWGHWHEDTQSCTY